jgi:hypothetical protein
MKQLFAIKASGGEYEEKLTRYTGLRDCIERGIDYS